MSDYSPNPTQSAAPEELPAPDDLDDDSPLDEFTEAQLDYVSGRLKQIVTAAVAQPELSEADLCDRYVESHQALVYANGRFWRNPWPNRPWVPVEDGQIAAELLDVIQVNQAGGVAPTRHRLNSVLALLRLRLAARVEHGRFDNTAGFLPFLNQLQPIGGGPHDWETYTPEHHVATTFPYEYDYHAACPHWDGFLQSTIPHAAEFVQEFAGYCLTHFTHLEMSLWLCGAPTSGKSTLIHGLQTMLGPFAGLLSLADLARRALDPDGLAGKRLLIADDAPPGFAAIPGLANIVDGAPFHLARPHGLPFQVQTHAKLVLGFNGLPAVDRRYASLYRRAALLVFPPRPDGSQDSSLKHRISKEGPGLFMWALRGWNRLSRRGRFQPPATMLAAANLLRLAASSPKDFVEQRCLRDPDARTRGADLVRAYEAWCAKQDLPSLKGRRLAEHWRDLGFEHHRLEGRAWWHGVQLVHTDLPVAPAELAPPPDLPATHPPASPGSAPAIPEP